MRLAFIVFSMALVLALALHACGSLPTPQRVVRPAGLEQALADLARQLRPPKGRKLALAVADPVGPGDRLTGLSLSVVEGLSRELLKEGFARVLERRMLNQILEQQQLELSRYINPGTRAPLDQKASLDALVFVRIQDKGEHLKISARLVDLAAADTLSNGVVRVAVNESIRNMLSHELVADLTVSAKPLPPGAVLRVGGQVRSLTDKGVVLKGLPQGRHELVIESPCLEYNYSQPFDLNRNRVLQVKLEPQKARLELLVNPPGARIAVDGLAGELKLDHNGAGSLSLPSGTHTITATASGLPPKVREVTLECGRNYPLQLDLTRREYPLSLRVIPANARVSLDGLPLRLDAGGGGRLAAARGKHTIRVEGDPAEYMPQERTVEIYRPADLLIELKPVPVQLEFSGIYQDPAHMESIKPLRNGSVLYSGWYYAVGFKVSRRAWVYIFQLDSRGKLARLYPDPYFPQQANPVRSGEWIWTPPPDFRSRLDRNTGREVIYLVASPRPDRRLDELFKRLQAVKDNPGVLADATRVLQNEITSRGREDVVSSGQQSLQYGVQLFNGAVAVLESSGGQVYTLEFIHR